MGSGGSAPEAPQMSQEEKDLYKKQSDLLDQINKTYGTSIDTASQNSDILKQVSGLFTQNGDGKVEINHAALQKQTELNQLNMDRYERALKGTLPVSEGLTQQKADDFKLLKENAARRGINISGETPETATSDSTSGAALLGNFNKTYGLRVDAERNAQLSNNSNSTLSLLGASQDAGPASLLNSGMNLANSYSNAASPYKDQRMLQYQSDVNQYNYDQQGKAGTMGAIGTIGGGVLGGMYGGPMGAMVGAKIGGSLGTIGA